jgi:hypothetical protein
MEHGVVYDLPPVRDEFPFADGIRYKGDVVDVRTGGVLEMAVSMQLEDPAYVSHEGGVAEPEAFHSFALYEGDGATGNDIIACLEWAGF